MTKRQKDLIIIFLVIILSGVFIYVLITKPTLFGEKRKLNLGLDLQGGLSVVLAANPQKGKPITSETMDKAVDIIHRRVDKMGVTEPEVSRMGKDNILVQLPGVKNPEETIKIIGQTAMLEFKPEITTAPTETGAATPTSDLSKVLWGPTVLTGDYLTSAKVDFQQGSQPVVALAFNDAGAKIFEQVTTQYKGKRLGIFLDNVCESAPVIKDTISGGKAVIEGLANVDEANTIALVLESGRLPVDLKEAKKELVSPTLGKDSWDKALLAGIIGLILIALFMVGFYRGLGFVAWLSVFAFGVFLLGILSLIPATLTLPGIAGIIVTMGIAFDGNVIIYERIKEDVRSGKTIRAAVESGFRHGLITIVDASIVSLITAGILFYLTSGGVKGFAFNLMLGTLISMFTSLVFTHSILRVASEYKWFDNPKILGLHRRVE